MVSESGTCAIVASAADSACPSPGLSRVWFLRRTCAHVHLLSRSSNPTFRAAAYLSILASNSAGDSATSPISSAHAR